MGRVHRQVIWRADDHERVKRKVDLHDDAGCRGTEAQGLGDCKTKIQRIEALRNDFELNLDEVE